MAWLSRVKLAACASILALATLLSGCGSQSDSSGQKDASGLSKISLQLDWMPEAAHGGFYQAQVEGAYEELGLSVEILSGGTAVQPVQRVALGKVDFGIGRLDDVVLAVQQKIPLVAVASFKQHDPQGIMVHASDPAQGLQDLDGRDVMTSPGSAMVLWLEKHYDIKINLIPIDYGIQRFASNSEMTQQCFVTSQPFYLEEMGVPVRTFLFSDGGFDPGRVIYCRRSLVEEKPELVAAFIKASLKGWNSYLYGDREATDARLLELNPRNTPELNNFTVKKDKELYIFEGRPGLGVAPGALPPERVQGFLDILAEIDLLESTLTPEDIVPYEFLPGFIKEPDLSLRPVREPEA